MSTWITAVTLFLRGRPLERKYLALLLLCVLLACIAFILLHQGELHHWHGLFADDPGTPWDGGDGTST